jgi:hypothetical protein
MYNLSESFRKSQVETLVDGVMKTARIMLTGFGLTVALFAFEFYVAAAVFLLGCLTLLLILMGTLIRVPSRVFRLLPSPAEAGRFVRLEGKIISQDWYEQLEFRVEERGFVRLAMIGTVALFLIESVVAVRGNPFLAYLEVGQSGDYILFSALAYVSFVPTSIAAIWFRERIRLARSIVTIGSLDPRGGYTFCDQGGRRFGGTMLRTSREPEDNACVVFYASESPDDSTSSAGLRFHRLRIRMPGR